MNKKGFTLVELLAVIVILGILSTFLVPSIFKMVKNAKENSFNVLVESFEENAKLYTSRHRDEIESHLDQYNYYSLTLNDLKTDNLLKTPISDPRTDEEIDLTKKIYIVRETDQTLSICYEEKGCYAPIKLVDKITDPTNIVTGAVQGLHQDTVNNFYYYNGSNPSNWIEFNGILWRIVKVNSDSSIKLIYEGKRNSTSTNENGAISNGTFDNLNVNDFNSNITIKTTLQNWYNATIDDSSKAKVLPVQFCIGKIAYSASGVAKTSFLSNECTTKTGSTYSVGLLSGSEYLYASLDSTCLTSYKTTGDNGYTCKNQNYLYKNVYNYWTMTLDNNTTNVWTATSLGSLGATVASSTSNHIRPVITLRNDVYIDRGNGTFDIPYVLKDIISVDKTNPVITMLGENPTKLFVGDSYSDVGATATDNVDGNITNKIIKTSNLNTAVPGTYRITYIVSDISGNKTSVNRTLIVFDTDIVMSGLVLWLDGEDFKNSPPTTTWNDRSTKANNGTTYNFNYNAASGSNGSGGVRFDGVDDSIYCPATSSLNIEKGTIETILKFSAWNAGFDAIVWKNGGSWIDIDYGILRLSTNHTLVGALSNGTTSLSGGGPVTPDLSLNTIYYVTFSWDGSTAKMYLNGALVDTKATTIVPRNRESQIQISEVYKLNGDIYSIKIYNKALTDLEIMNNYTVEKALKE